MEKFSVIVCGSRDIRDKEFVFKTLDFLFSNKNLAEITIIQGDQKSHDKHLDIYYGADYFAKLWAEQRGVECKNFPAPWEGLVDTPKKLLKKGPYGSYWPGAGAYRNKQMADENPNACIGFLSSRSKNAGTKNMLNLCIKRGIPVKKFYL